jgi:hypothetical protein
MLERDLEGTMNHPSIPPVRLVSYAAIVVCAAGMAAGSATSVAAQEIPRDEYLNMLPLSLPRLGLQSEASVELNLFGDSSAPGYVDVDPVDGIDDRRNAVLMQLAVRFAPYLVQNTTNVPLNFDIFIDNRDDFALTIDTWDTSGEQAEFLTESGVNFSVLGEATCTDAARSRAFEQARLPTSNAALEDCKLLQLMERYTPGAGIVDSRDNSLVRTTPSEFNVLYFNFPGEGAQTWEVAYEPEWERTPDDRRPYFVHSYVHPFINESADGGYEIVLQYWFFYPTNDSGMDHEGDWEHINVVVSPRSMVERGLDRGTVADILDGRISTDGDLPDPLVIKRVDYYFHEFVWPVDFSSPNVYLPREEWQAQVDAEPRDRFRQDDTWRKIRYMAYADDAETIINTHPLGYIGADNKGLNQALEPPGGSNQEPHGTYPFPGRYNNIGPGGTTDQVARYVDIREHLRAVEAGEVPWDPTFENRAVISLVHEDRLRIVPDWERVEDLARTDASARRDWAWLLLPLRWGYPATRSPFAGALKHYNTGNVAPQGPSFNAGWNVSGSSSGFHLYEPHSLPSVFPLAVQDNFRNDLGFLNLTVPLLLNLPPLDFVARLAAYPFRAALGRRDPVYFPRDGLPFRFVGLSAGVFAAPADEGWDALALNSEQRDPFVGFLLAHILINGGDTETAITGVEDVRDDWVGPFGQVAFYIGNRFVSENTVRHSRSTIGADIEFTNIPTYSYRANLNYWEYSGSLRYNLRTERFQPFLKGGYGWSWYRLENVQGDGVPFDPTNSSWFDPGWWPTVWHYGLGLEWVPWRRAGVAGGGFEVAMRLEYARFQQTLRIDFSDVPLDELQILFPTLGDVPSETRVHRNDFLLGFSITF